MSESESFILKDKQEQAPQEVQLPEVTFATFILSLSSSALVLIGELEDPETKGKNKNLSMAKHTIDILGMLQQKTKGNLSKDEDELLKNILTDLRFLYVKEMNKW